MNLLKYGYAFPLKVQHLVQAIKSPPEGGLLTPLPLAYSTIAAIQPKASNGRL